MTIVRRRPLQENKYYVEAFTDHKIVSRQHFYKVKWQGEVEETWVLAKQLEEDMPLHFTDLVKDYKSTL